MIRTAWLTGMLVAAFAWTLAAAEPSLQVLEEDGDGLLYNHMMEIMRRQFAERREDLQTALVSVEKAEQRRRRQRAEFRQMLGEFPEPTPLNPQVTGTIDREGYRIERVVYESRPCHHVTANLYVPDGDGPFPGVLVPCGHSRNGKASAAYQAACIRMVRQGLIVLIFDPISQGERHQIAVLPPPNAKVGSPRPSPTVEHILVHPGALLVGRNTGHYILWDGIRSMDYLAGRPEVDAKRLGMSGNSGGGTMTTWQMAIDDRIVAAAPSCFITTLQRIYEELGPSDGEQQFPDMGLKGLDHADFLMMRAPRPTMILAARQDFFPFDGTLQAYDEAKRFFAVYGKADHVGLFVHDDKHGWSRPRRMAAERFMRRWLLDQQEPIASEADFEQEVLPDGQLQVTKTGQVIEEYSNEITVPQITLKKARELASARERFWGTGDRAAHIAKVRELLALDRAKGIVQTELLGEVSENGYTIKMLLIRRDGFPIPALLFTPDKSEPDAMPALLVDSRGMAQAAEAAGGPLQLRLAAGRVVLAVDVRGYGETRDTKSRAYNDEFRNTRLAHHIGQPLLGQRVADVLAAVQVLGEVCERRDAPVELVAAGRMAPVALHAAFLDRRIAALECHGGIRSWIDDVLAKADQPNLMAYSVPNALKWYDLPDLQQAVARDIQVRAHESITGRFGRAAATAACVRLHRRISNMSASPSFATLSSPRQNRPCIASRALSLMGDGSMQSPPEP